MKKVVLLVTVMMLVFAPITAYADQFNPGKSLGDWLVEQVQGLVIGIVALVVGFFLWKRDTINLVWFIVLAIVAAAFIFAGNDILKWFTSMFKNIFQV